VDEATAEAVRERAGYCCENCRLPAEHVQVPFEVEHVVAKQHGGSDAPGNLAFACLHCNRHKGPNLSGSRRREPGSGDPVGGYSSVAVSRPTRDRSWSGATGLTRWTSSPAPVVRARYTSPLMAVTATSARG